MTLTPVVWDSQRFCALVMEINARLMYTTKKEDTVVEVPGVKTQNWGLSVLFFNSATGFSS